VVRLKQHLVTVEESGTQEVLAFEEREMELRRKLQVFIRKLFYSCKVAEVCTPSRSNSFQAKRKLSQNNCILKWFGEFL
jgi:hypothetical protein